MPQFYASTSKGLSEALAKELEKIGLCVGRIEKQGCFFEGSWSDCVRANLRSHLATRISLPVLDFPAYKMDELYSNIRKHDFTKYLTPKMSFFIKSDVRECFIRDQRFLAMKFKDAISDQFNEKFSSRPSIDKDSPHVRFFIFGSRNQYRVSVDTTGQSLGHRGYRKSSYGAPLREHLAAGLIRLTDWDQKTPLVDPMCGSGTLLIEAALMLKRISPGSFHKKFSFQFFKHIPEKLLDEELEKLMAEETTVPDFKLLGFDKSAKSIQMARENALRAGVEDQILFQKADAIYLKPEVQKGMMVTNPPHGIRMGDEFFLEELYKNFSYNLKKNFPGWSVWILSGDPRWTGFLKMKSKKHYSIDNGGVNCRWIHYLVNK